LLERTACAKVLCRTWARAIAHRVRSYGERGVVGAYCVRESSLPHLGKSNRAQGALLRRGEGLSSGVVPRIHSHFDRLSMK